MWLIKPSKDGKFYFVWRNSENNEIQLTSETYVTEAGAERGIEDFVNDLVINTGIAAMKNFDFEYTEK
jgi:uncharacterized protein YegP (UPF0339 family)